MSRNKQQRNSFSMRRAKNTLRRIFVPFFKKPKPQQEVSMLLPDVRKVMSALRTRSRQVRPNNKKIDEWVDQFINRCVLEGKPVTILTQWCISKDLEVRYRERNGFVPTRAEEKLFSDELFKITDLFRENGIAINWIITFNRSYLDSGRISKSIEGAYKTMVTSLAEPLIEAGWLILLDWEDDFLGARPEPEAGVLASIRDLVPDGALELEIKRHSTWAREEAHLTQSDEELEQDVFYQIGCEAREGQLLSGVDSLMGVFILVPLELPERYDFFELKSPSFKERIVSVLPPYPWRVR